jgi:hypothetical protein
VYAHSYQADINRQSQLSTAATILTSQLRLLRKDVEGILKHFLDSGNQFHFTPNCDPDLAEVERVFEIRNTDAKEIYIRRLPSIMNGF